MRLTGKPGIGVEIWQLQKTPNGSRSVQDANRKDGRQTAASRAWMQAILLLARMSVERVVFSVGWVEKQKKAIEKFPAMGR